MYPIQTQTVSIQDLPRNYQCSRHETAGTPYSRTTPGSRITPHSRTTPYPRTTPRSRGTPCNTTPGTGRSGTPRNTSTSMSTPAQPDTLILVAVVQGRGHAKNDIGIASIDMKSPSISLSQYSDTATFVRTLTKLNILSPVEIIFPSTVTDAGGQSELYKLVTEATSCPITSVQRKYFNESLGVQYIKHFSMDNMDDIQTKDKYYCLSAVGALLKYIEFIQHTVFAAHSIPVRFTGSDKTTLIDATTAKLLELVSNAQDSRSAHTLFGVLNKTKTSGGAKILRSTILQPPSDVDTITLRQDCVDELLHNEELFNNLESVMARFVDVDTTISLLIQVPKQETLKTAENRIMHIICLKHLLELVKPLSNAIKDSQNNLFKAMFENLQDERFAQIKARIDKIVHEDTYFQKGALNMRTQKCFAVKPNLNGLLDVARRTYSEMVDDVAETIKKLAQKYNLPLKTGFTSARGFYIIISMKSPPDLPPVFVKVQKQKNSVTCTTGNLIKLNDRINDSLNDIYLMTNEVTKGLLQEIYPLVGCLYKLSECSAMLDMITSFAAVCALSDYTRPEFTDTLALKDSVHPIIGKIDSVQAVSNDVFASSASSFNIITGPNMSGKSTYIKQVALLQIMAQVGCFIPASYASLKLVDNIFSRIGCDDDIETNASTFTIEMREIKFILDNITDKSLVIIDELGRGTGVEEGAALCFAISEHILTHSKPFVFFVTHFQELEHLENIYPNVVNYHFQVNYELAPESTSEKVQFLRKLSKGPGPHKNYGIKLAKLSALPPEITADAEKISAELQKNCSYSTTPARTEKEMNEQNVYSLAEHLLQTVKNNAMSENEMMNYLKSLQEECLRMNDSSDMDGITEDGGRSSKEVSFDGAVAQKTIDTSVASNESTELDYTDMSLTDVTALDADGNVNSIAISSLDNITRDCNPEYSRGGADKRRKFDVEYSTSRGYSDRLSRSGASQSDRTDHLNTTDENLPGFRRNDNDINTSRFDVEYSTSKSQSNIREASTSDFSEEKNFEFRFQTQSSSLSVLNESSCKNAKFYKGLSVKRKLS
ncbi:hypothetical protein ACHWQZ_G017698 [Mnemiopsis leidyi]